MGSFSNISNKVAKESIKLTWTIPDLEEVRKDKLAKHYSPIIILGEKLGIPTEWKFNLVASNTGNSSIVGERGYLGLYATLVKCPNNVVNIPVNCTFTIPSKTPNINFFRRVINTPYTSKPKGNSWGYSNVIPQDGPLPLTLGLTETGALEVNIELAISKPEEEPFVALQNQVERFETIFKKKLSSDMEKMYAKHLEGGSHPTNVCSKDGMKLTVYPGILAVRSPVFQERFEKNENSNGILEISDISGDSLDSLFYFMYTGMLKSNWKDSDVIEELVYGAHKYKQTDLLEFFDEVLNLVCTRDNCGKLVSLAKLANLKTAEKELLEFFKKGTLEIEEMVQFAKDAECKWKIEEKPVSQGENSDLFDDFVAV